MWRVEIKFVYESFKKYLQKYDTIIVGICQALLRQEDASPAEHSKDARM